MFEASELNLKNRRVQKLYRLLFLMMTLLLILPVLLILGTLIVKGSPILFPAHGSACRIGFALHPHHVFHRPAGGVDPVDPSPVDPIRAGVQPEAFAPFRFGGEAAAIDRIVQQANRDF